MPCIPIGDNLDIHCYVDNFAHPAEMFSSVGGERDLCVSTGDGNDVVQREGTSVEHHRHLDCHGANLHGAHRQFKGVYRAYCTDREPL